MPRPAGEWHTHRCPECGMVITHGGSRAKCPVQGYDFTGCAEHTR